MTGGTKNSVTLARYVPEYPGLTALVFNYFEVYALMCLPNYQQSRS